MAINKVDFFGETLVDLTDSTVSENNLIDGVIAYNASGERIVGEAIIPSVVESATPKISVSSSGYISAVVEHQEGYILSDTKTVGQQLQTLGETTVTPTTTEQTVVNSGVYTTGDIKVSAISTETKIISPSTTSQDVTPSTGKYLTKVTVNAMPSGSLSTPTVNSSGLVTSGVSTSGYVATGTTKTLQLTTKGAATITPTESQQTIASGQYLTGVQTIAAIPNTYIGSGVVIQKYYTGSSTPSSSIGNDGDLYLRL